MPRRRLLLISSSTVHGSGYLDHCEPEIRDVLPAATRLLFVPFALADRDGYAARFATRVAAMGYGCDSLHAAGSQVAQFKLYSNCEHLMVVADALPDVFAWFDSLAK